MEIYFVKILNVSEEDLNKLRLFIGTENKCKIDKFINKRDKIRTLIGEILVRFIVMEKLKIKNTHITFDKNKYGKPYLRDYPKFNFNISHSGDFVACAIDDKSIGIDVEQMKHIEYKEIAESFFSLSEVDYIFNNDLDNKLSRFYEIWTLKESYIKCSGQGLSIPLNLFSIDIDQYRNIKVLIDNERKEHTLKSFDIEQGYKMAVCSLSEEITDNITRVDQNILINNFLKYSNAEGNMLV